MAWLDVSSPRVVLRDQSKEARRASKKHHAINARGCAAAGLLFWCSPKKELAETTRKNDGSDQPTKEVQKNRIASLLRQAPVAASDERNEDSASFRGLFHYL